MKEEITFLFVWAAVTDLVLQPGQLRLPYLRHHQIDAAGRFLVISSSYSPDLAGRRSTGSFDSSDLKLVGRTELDW
uniref:Uncharacterized protein n=1 Tax=Kalanchoe fedtschenkoi TaxID=63787 RepID=A0A7N0T8T0_KALFE